MRLVKRAVLASALGGGLMMGARLCARLSRHAPQPGWVQRVCLTVPAAGLLGIGVVPVADYNDQAAAGKEAQHLIEHMEKDPAFEGTEEPLRIYLSLFNYLKKTKDLRTSAVLQNAIGLLNTQVSKLHSLGAQQVFIENVPWRRELQRLSKN